MCNMKNHAQKKRIHFYNYVLIVAVTKKIRIQGFRNTRVHEVERSRSTGTGLPCVWGECLLHVLFNMEWIRLTEALGPPQMVPSYYFSYEAEMPDNFYCVALRNL